ncbi:dienelactone hydrolase family protein [Mangrovitalea sediminis]|uniref:dienelactone hydrolase family protein n=1 Tax=Mangrovitalea sediminis TaxID=1982043 RepID=UPI000BE52924|nr:alpha/beta family hydrolase [Mangrovitalea sediminis]
MDETHTADIVIDSRGTLLEGALTVPPHCRGIVAFAHGSGSSRFSRRNQQVAHTLNDSGLATLLFDLLSAEENEQDVLTTEFRFNIPLLALRMTDAVDWISRNHRTAQLPIGLFGASTGAAAALIAAAKRPQQVSAVVSRGGRPDLAGDDLRRVRAPTLLIVGGWDGQVITLNQMAARRLECEHQIVIVPEATHLFEEPGKLEEVARLAADWFCTRLKPGR